MASKCNKPVCRSTMPEYKKNNHIGHSYATCPFSSQADNKRVRIMLRDLVYDGVNAYTDLLAIYTTDPDASNYGDYVVADNEIDNLLVSSLGYARSDHTTISGNKEDTNAVGADDYLQYSTFSGTVYMATELRGGWGYECAFNDCNYRQNNDGVRYFYL